MHKSPGLDRFLTFVDAIIAMDPVESYDRVVGVVTAAWTLTIVFMPFPTALVGIYGVEERPVIAVYLLTLFVSSALLTVLALYLARKPELHQADVESSKRMAVPSVVTTVLTGLATALGVLVPQVNYGALLLLLLTGVFTNLANRRLHLPQQEA
ncbi:hypothetical protein [Cryptosporangium sp. NPDC048952]|uniref:hypothetical protein n=1 Tax=Cryptosporangium sp. NPDC048952 TaxID=3363961 RepID=UPI003718C44D